MARMARVVVPNYPHHVTQRGNRRQATFFCRSDYQLYIEPVAQYCRIRSVRVRAYCLMPNHVHFVEGPEAATGLGGLFGEADKRYSRHINFRQGWRGHPWRERFFSCPTDEAHLIAAARYIERNPVRAQLCRQAHNWPWSSARAHEQGEDDELVGVAPLLALVPDWRGFLNESNDPTADERLRLHSRTGGPLGDHNFVEKLESITGRTLQPRKPGPKRRGDL